MHRTGFFELNRQTLSKAIKKGLKIRAIRFPNDNDEFSAFPKNDLHRFFSRLRCSLRTVDFPFMNAKCFKFYFKLLRHTPNIKKVSTEFIIGNKKVLSSTLKRMKNLNNAYKSTDQRLQTWFNYSRKNPSTKELTIEFQQDTCVSKIALKRKLPNLRSISYRKIPLYTSDKIENLVDHYFNHLPMSTKNLNLNFEYPQEIKECCLLDSEIFWDTLGKTSALETLHINLFKRLESNWDKFLSSLTIQLKMGVWPCIQELTLSIGTPIMSTESLLSLCWAISQNKFLRSVILNCVQVVVDSQDFISMMNDLLSLPKLETLAFKDILPVRFEELILPEERLEEIVQLEGEFTELLRIDEEKALESDFAKLSLSPRSEKKQSFLHERTMKLKYFYIFPGYNKVKIDTEILLLYFSRICKFSRLQSVDVSYQGDDSFLNQTLYLISQTKQLTTLSMTFFKANSKSDTIQFAPQVKLENIRELNLHSMHHFPLVPRLKFLNLIGKQLIILTISDQRLKLFEIEIWIKRIKEIKTLKNLHFVNNQSLIIDVKSVKNLLILLLYALDHLEYCQTRLMRGSVGRELNQEMIGVYPFKNLSLSGSNFE